MRPTHPLHWTTVALNCPLVVQFIGPDSINTTEYSQAEQVQGTHRSQLPTPQCSTSLGAFSPRYPNSTWVAKPAPWWCPWLAFPTCAARAT